MHQSTDFLTCDNLLEVAEDIHVEYIDREVVLHAHCGSCDVHNLEILVNNSMKIGITVVLSGVNDSVRSTLVHSGFDKILGHDNICSNINLALERAKQLL